jgi:hypothetical protein
MNRLFLIVLFSVPNLFGALTAQVPRRASQRLVLDVPMQIVETTSTVPAYRPYLPLSLTFLPVTIHGKTVQLLIDVNEGGTFGSAPNGIVLEPAAIASIGLSLADTITRLDSLVIGTDVRRNVPLSIHVQAGGGLANRKADWNKWPKGSPVVGRINVYYLTTHYDVEIDYAQHRVALYAYPSRPSGAVRNWGFIAPDSAWLPSRFNKTNCSKLLKMGNGSMWLAFDLKVGGQPAIAGLEWAEGGYSPRISAGLVNAMEIPANSSRFIAIPPSYPGGYYVDKELDSVAFGIGTSTFWTGASAIYPTFDFGENFPGEKSLVLWSIGIGGNNKLSLKSAFFLSTSSGQVCVSAS